MKVKHEFQILKRLGNFSKQIKRDLFFLLDRSKISDFEIANFIESKIIKQGYEIAFPTNLGFRNIVSHRTPDNQTYILYPRKELIRIDFGIKHLGHIIDTALTYNLSKSKKIDSILNSYQELFLQVEKIKIGDCINIIGKLVNKLLLKRHNLNLISCLSGHAIQMNLLHSDPIIPNYYFKTKNTFTQNLLFTIEPYISLGYTKISLGPCNIFRKNNQFMCERWNNIKSPQESYPVILSTNQEVLHVEHTFYLTKSGCYRLT